MAALWHNEFTTRPSPHQVSSARQKLPTLFQFRKTLGQIPYTIPFWEDVATVAHAWPLRPLHVNQGSGGWTWVDGHLWLIALVLVLWRERRRDALSERVSLW
jgi:hypothetical protein